MFAACVLMFAVREHKFALRVLVFAAREHKISSKERTFSSLTASYFPTVLLYFIANLCYSSSSDPTFAHICFVLKGFHEIFFWIVQGGQI